MWTVVFFYLQIKLGGWGLAVIWQICEDSVLGKAVCGQLVNQFAVRKFKNTEDLKSAFENKLGLPDLILKIGNYTQLSMVNQSEVDQNHMGIPICSLNLDPNNANTFRSSSIKKVFLQIEEVLSRKVFKSKNDFSNIFRDIHLDRESRLLSFDSQPNLNVYLPTKEARLLSLLLEKSGEAIPREFICRKLWPTTKVSAKSLNTYICRLRLRLKGSEVSIESVYGGGYVIR